MTFSYCRPCDSGILIYCISELDLIVFNGGRKLTLFFLWNRDVFDKKDCIVTS